MLLVSSVADQRSKKNGATKVKNAKATPTLTLLELPPLVVGLKLIVGLGVGLAVVGLAVVGLGVGWAVGLADGLADGLALAVGD